MTISMTTQCAERISYGTSWRSRMHKTLCSRPATLHENGKDWCWQHAPSAEKEKQAMRDAKNTTKFNNAHRAQALTVLRNAVVDTAVMAYRVKNDHVDYEVTDADRDSAQTAADEAIEAYLRESE